MAKPSQQISPQQWDEWARNPVTVAFRDNLLVAVEETKEQWASGAFPDEKGNWAALGGLDVLKQVIQWVADHKVEGVSHE